MIKLSIIIPVYNSSKILEKLINEIDSNLSGILENNYEIILVNDKSIDNSWEKFYGLSKKYTYVKGINLMYNVGQHGAIFVGLKYSNGKKITKKEDLDQLLEGLQKAIEIKSP